MYLTNNRRTSKGSLNVSILLQRSSAILLILGCVLQNALAQTDTVQSLKYGGNSRALNAQCVQLTPDSLWSTGFIWSTAKIDLAKDQTWRFRLNFGNKKDPLGADGMAFFLSETQQVSDTSSGRFLGLKNLKPSFLVEFDVFKNATGGGDFDLNDPDQSHVAFHRDGNTRHRDTNCLSKFPTNDGWIQMHPTKLNVQDGKWYEVEVTWNHRQNIVALYVDGSLRQALAYDIPGRIFSGNREVYWGISGATGGVSNKQQVCFDWDTTRRQAPDTVHGWKAPNAFTPNGDGINDVFMIRTGLNSTLEIREIKVFSRWGNLLYEGPNGWDGNHQGRPVPSGAYVWLASIQESDGTTNTYSGEINLIR